MAGGVDPHLMPLSFCLAMQRAPFSMGRDQGAGKTHLLDALEAESQASTLPNWLSGPL